MVLKKLSIYGFAGFFIISGLPGLHYFISAGADVTVQKNSVLTETDDDKVVEKLKIIS